MIKYYFYSYYCELVSWQFPKIYNNVSMQHPLDIQIERHENYPEISFNIVHWQEITEEEFKKYDGKI